MRTSSRLVVLIAAASSMALAVLACEGSSGTSQNMTRECSTSRGAGSCTGSIARMSGMVSLEFEDKSMVSTDVIDVSGEFRVEQGRLEVSLTAPDGGKSTVVVDPGPSVPVVGPTKGTFEGFIITLTALDDEAVSIDYTLEYMAR